jgi:hypothetical protein
VSLVTNAGWRHSAWIVLVASVVRGIGLWVHRSQLAADPDAYREIARGLTVCKTFGIVSLDSTTHLATASPTAFRPPLYPWILSWLTQPDGALADAAVACLHLSLGVFTVAMTFLVARRMLATLSSSSSADSSADSHAHADVSKQTLRPVISPDSRSGDSTGAALFAACLVMIDPLLLQSSALVMTETLATALVVLVLWFWLNLIDAWEPKAKSTSTSPRRLVLNSVLLGLSFSLAYLCRPTFIVWPVLIGMYLVGLAVKHKHRQPIIATVVMLSVVLLTVGVWTWRNLKQLGHPVWATTHGGYTLLLGNNPPFYEHLRTTGASNVPFWRRNWEPQFFFDRWAQRHEADPRLPEFWDAAPLPKSEAQAVVGGSEIAEDRLANETAKAVIQRDPMGFLLACRWRWERLFSPLPLQTSDRPSRILWIVGAFYTFTFALVAIGLWRLGRRIFALAWVPAMALWVALATVHTFYWTDMRMRAPAVPVLSILAAASIGTRRFGASKIG